MCFPLFYFSQTSRNSLVLGPPIFLPCWTFERKRGRERQEQRAKVRMDLQRLAEEVGIDFYLRGC